MQQQPTPQQLVAALQHQVARLNNVVVNANVRQDEAEMKVRERGTELCRVRKELEEWKSKCEELEAEVKKAGQGVGMHNATSFASRVPTTRAMTAPQAGRKAGKAAFINQAHIDVMTLIAERAKTPGSPATPTEIWEGIRGVELRKVRDLNSWNIFMIHRGVLREEETTEARNTKPDYVHPLASSTAFTAEARRLWSLLGQEFTGTLNSQAKIKQAKNEWASKWWEKNQAEVLAKRVSELTDTGKDRVLGRKMKAIKQAIDDLRIFNIQSIFVAVSCDDKEFEGCHYSSTPILEEVLFKALFPRKDGGPAALIDLMTRGLDTAVRGLTRKDAPTPASDSTKNAPTTATDQLAACRQIVIDTACENFNCGPDDKEMGKHFWDKLYANCARLKIGYGPIELDFKWKKFREGKVGVFTDNKKVFLDGQFKMHKLETNTSQKDYESWCMLKACANAQAVWRDSSVKDKWKGWEDLRDREFEKLKAEKTWPAPSEGAMEM